MKEVLFISKSTFQKAQVNTTYITGGKEPRNSKIGTRHDEQAAVMRFWNLDGGRHGRLARVDGI
jgi:hypothetical protein